MNDTLFDEIIDKRLKYLRGIEQKVSIHITGNLQQDFEKLIEEPLKNPKKNPYFIDIYNRSKTHPITWRGIEGISEIAGMSNIYHNTVSGQIKQVQSVVDNSYRMLLEPIAAHPYFYMDKSMGVEPNCVGASQVIAALYTFDKPISDIEMLHVLSSKRRDNLLGVLKRFDNLPVISLNGEKWVDTNFDNFSRAFKKEYLRDIILDQILSIEESDHIAIAQKNGEVFDFKLERQNFKKTESCSIEDGIWATGINSLLNLYQHFDKPIDREWMRVKDRLEDTCKSISLTTEHSFEADKFNEMQSLYAEDLPIRYFMAESMLREFEPKLVSSIKSRIKNIYNHPKALEVIASRYLPEDLLVYF